MERCEKGKHLIQPLAGTTLGIVYAVDLPGESPMKRKLIPITWTMVETWGVPLTELLQTAEDNRLAIRRPLVMPIDEILREAGTEIPSRPLLVATNECRSYGAVSITYPEIQEQVRAWYGGRISLCYRHPCMRPSAYRQTWERRKACLPWFRMSTAAFCRAIIWQRTFTG